MIKLGYPTQDEEISILERFRESDPLIELASVAAPEEISEMQQARKSIHISRPVKEYIIAIVSATRKSAALRLGASPRGSLGLMRASQALTVLRGRDYVLPDDVKYLAEPVLAHRLILKEEEELRGLTREGVLEEIINETPVPSV
jgi:MoxR-like ATPase